MEGQLPYGAATAGYFTQGVLFSAQVPDVARGGRRDRGSTAPTSVHSADGQQMRLPGVLGKTDEGPGLTSSNEKR